MSLVWLSWAPRTSACGSEPAPTIQYAMEPSPAPEVKTRSSCGCHVTDAMSLLYGPTCEEIVLSVRMSVTFKLASFDPVTKWWPFWFHFKQFTEPLCMCSVDKHCRCAPTRGSQSLTTQSLPPPLATTLLVSCHCTHLTSPPWPFNVVSALALAKSNILIVASSAHVANFKSVGLKLTPRIGSPCACVCFKLLKFICQYLICPESSAEMSQFSLRDTVAVLTGLLCACKIVSKLKLAAFQSVNSPFCEHVSTLRPSGMNITVCGLFRFIRKKESRLKSARVFQRRSKIQQQNDEYSYTRNKMREQKCHSLFIASSTSNPTYT